METTWRDLESALTGRIDGEVRFDAGSRALYATDASNYRRVPIGVVVPRTKADVVAAVEVCRDHGAPILPRGGGTSLAGQCCNAAVVLDLSRHLGRILELDPVARTVRVEPGVVLDDLQAAAGAHGLAFGPDPATHASCTLGGMLGNDACGVHSVVAGKTSDNVVSLEVLTYDGAVFEIGPTNDAAYRRILDDGGRRAEIHRRLRALAERHAERIRAEVPDIPRRVSGYNLDRLLPENGFDPARALVGSEGTLATILGATLRLLERPRARALVVLGFEDMVAAAERVPEILAHEPIGLEGMDAHLTRAAPRPTRDPGDAELLPGEAAWLLVEFGGKESAHAIARALELVEELGGSTRSAVVHADPARQARVWAIREAALGATARVPDVGDMRPGWEDSAVHPADLADYLRDLSNLLDRHGLEAIVYGHFGDGCVHCRIPFDLRTAGGREGYRAFVHDAAELCCGIYGGSLSGEHGDGLARGPLLGHMYSEELLDAMRAFKAIWDPDDRMNPGRIVRARDVTDDLRAAVAGAPPEIETRFAYADDDGHFARAVERCVGVGACRRTGGGTMCPSYMVTRDERHSTRGRARLLFEMLNGEVLDGWRDAAVLESLDLCLGCKGCKSDCPASVDMATYKSEFLARHWAGRLRPRAHYAMGSIAWSARLASRVPRLVNAATRAPGVSGVLKWVAGIAPERELPRFAGETFTAWFRTRGRPGGGARRGDRSAPPGDAGRPEVLLFPDTFNDHFHPEVARAAVEVLEWAGFRVAIPPRRLCCGRPLVHYGMLRLAERELRRVLGTLRPWIRAGVPVVGLEPSCVATFRDELGGLFPDDADAKRLGENAWLLSEFLKERVDEGRWPTPGGEALLHVHCHQASILTRDADRTLLERLGYACDVPDSGCCGMAGSFGYERDKVGVSIACGERVLLPAVRAAASDTVIVTSGYSCREQIAQTTGRRPRHVAEVARDAIDGASA